MYASVEQVRAFLRWSHELYFDMNTQRINSNELKILLALQHISDDAQQWKENEKTDLDDATITDK